MRLSMWWLWIFNLRKRSAIFISTNFVHYEHYITIILTEHLPHGAAACTATTELLFLDVVNLLVRRSCRLFYLSVLQTVISEFHYSSSYFVKLINSCKLVGLAFVSLILHLPTMTFNMVQWSLL